MKKYFSYLLTMNWVLNILFILSIALVLSIEFVLSNIPEFFNGGARLGNIVVNLSLAFIASYIFYFIVVHIKNENDQDNIKEYVVSKTQFIISDAKALIEALKKEADLPISSSYPNKEELDNICLKVDPRKKAPLVLGKAGTPANWIQYFDYFRDRSEKAIKELFIFMPYLDTEFVKLVFAIQDCIHFQSIRFLVKLLPIGNTDLSSFSEPLLKYFDMTKKLEEYFDRKIKK